MRHTNPMEEILSYCELLKWVVAEQPSIHAWTCASQRTVQVNAGFTVLSQALKTQQLRVKIQRFHNNERWVLLIYFLRVASDRA